MSLKNKILGQGVTKTARELRTRLMEDWQGIRDQWASELTDDEKNEMGQICLSIAARLCWEDQNKLVRLFQDSEKAGVHFLPTHFYSPVPTVSEIDPAVYEKRYDRGTPGLVLDRDGHCKWLDILAKFGPEMVDYAEEGVAGDQRFFWKNPAFGRGDAILYYSMLRHLQPEIVIEIGSGYSTFLALDALEKNGKGRLTCIEPFPMDHLRDLDRDGKLTLIAERVQDVDPVLYESMSENDVLFIDSSHVCKIGSDVNYEFLELLPLLPPGSFVHVHDIFFPWEMPKSWVEDLNIFWNEQYLLMAFLMYNDTWNVEISNMYVGREMAEEFSARFGELVGTEPGGGGSIWLQRSKSAPGAAD